ncbi:hypothetical protein C8Q80DRAFT_1352200 [Daedaleopsis nitida]|nr:hypothetical protein C8Q80DRAFT_1352200 [Daedaleopsis nitida]
MSRRGPHTQLHVAVAVATDPPVHIAGLLHPGPVISGSDDVQFVPTRILDDWMRNRPLTHTATDDLNSFTLLVLRTLLARLASQGAAGATEHELLALLSAQCPHELWMNRQQVRDVLKRLADDSDDRSEVSADSAASTCSTGFAPFVPALDEMLRVNDEHRWEMHQLRAEGSLERLERDRQRVGGYYDEYVSACHRLTEVEGDEQ